MKNDAFGWRTGNETRKLKNRRNELFRKKNKESLSSDEINELNEICKFFSQKNYHPAYKFFKWKVYIRGECCCKSYHANYKAYVTNGIIHYLRRKEYNVISTHDEKLETLLSEMDSKDRDHLKYLISSMV
jgi:hypothetical protein